MERLKGNRVDIFPFGEHLTLTDYPKELQKKITLL